MGERAWSARRSSKSETVGRERRWVAMIEHRFAVRVRMPNKEEMSMLSKKEVCSTHTSICQASHFLHRDGVGTLEAVVLQHLCDRALEHSLRYIFRDDIGGFLIAG